jgi:hypothetical protein
MFENDNNQEEAKEKALFITAVMDQLVLFAEWLQYNGKYQLPEEQVNSFLKEQETECL